MSITCIKLASILSPVDPFVYKYIHKHHNNHLDYLNLEGSKDTYHKVLAFNMYIADIIFSLLGGHSNDQQ